MNDLETRIVDTGDLRIETRGLARVIRGYAIVFNRLSENLGGFRERIQPGAVDRTLREAVDLRALVDHEHSQILGRLSAGTLRVEKDGHGLKIEIDPPETTVGQNIVESIRRRDVTGMSFAFRTMPEGAVWTDEDPATGLPIRDVLDMQVREVSVVTFPAYPQTEVALRSLHAYEASRAAQRGGRPRTVSERLAWTAQRLR